ncbi:MAG: protein kinase [Planctomycetes bacterium]|nr:protein kinase [Planctomycetota bacterium]
MDDPRSTSSDDDRIAAIVERALEHGDCDADLDLAVLCGTRTDLVPAVREALAIARSLDGMAPLAADPLAGTVLGDRYELGERIGAGAMGAVHRARDRVLRRDVAIKLLHPGVFASDDAQARFLREAELLATLSHPHVVAVHDRGRTAGGIAWIAMELVDGVPLSRLIGEDDVATQVRRCAEVADALAAAHARGICHRDVKPSNVLIRKDGRAALVDFGIAVRAEDSGLTATHATIGTPHYLPPERARGRVAPDARQDVYSLGATLWHLLAGRPPFEGDTHAVLAQLQSSLPMALRAVSPSVPRDLEAIVDRAMDPRPQRRYATGADFAADLRAFHDGRPVAARPLSPLARRWRRVRQRPAPALAALAALLLVAFGVASFAVAARDAEARGIARKKLLRERITTIPALLTIEGEPASRPIDGPESVAASLRLLDSILELGEDLDARMLRASLRLDCGEHRAAADDVAAIASIAPSPYTEALVERYRSAKPDVRGVLAVDLAQLPARSTDVDRFLAGHHALRLRDVASFEAVARELAQARASVPAAGELRAIALTAVASTLLDQPNRRRRLFQQVLDESLAHAQERGASARTQHAIGSALLGLGRYADAVVPLGESVRLQPGRFGPLQNLGLALYGAGRFDEALEHLSAAIRIRPDRWEARHSLARVLCAMNRFDDATHSAEAIDGVELPRWVKPYLLGQIAVQRAHASLRIADPATARSHAQDAIRSFQASGEQGAPRARIEPSAAYAQALVDEDQARALTSFLAELGDQVDNPVHLANLAVLLPTDKTLTPAAVAALRLVFLRQAAARAPGRLEIVELLEHAVAGGPPANPGNDGR